MRWARCARRASAGAAVAACALLGPVAAAIPAGASSRPAPTEQVVVKLAAHAVGAASVLSAAPAAPVSAPGGRLIYNLPAGEAHSFVSSLRSSGKVAYAEVSPQVHATAITPNDPCFTSCTSPAPVTVEDASTGSVLTGTYNQANLQAIHAQQAWGYTQGNPNLVVAVLDSGVDAAHPDLAGKVIVGPTLCYNSGGTCTPAGNDALGHGTHVTGIIAADTNNAAGIAGLGWNVKVEMFKVLDDSGNGSEADVVSGIYDAVAAGAKVINMSFSSGVACGGPCYGPDEVAAVAYALDHGVTLVAAAGNDFSSTPEFPASLPGVMSVAATDNSGQVAYFSEYGQAANIAAPGVNILSTWRDGNYATDTGTSMSSPEVAAAAALVLSVHPSLSGPQVATILSQTAGPTSGNPIYGGMLNAGAAVQRAATMSSPPAGVNGYEMAGAGGAAYSFGFAPNYGSISGAINKPVVGVAADSGATGYWLVASDGGVFTFGDAGFYGSTGAMHLNKPIVGMAATPSGRGYWLVASDGGVFTFGDAGFYGSTGAMHLNKPIVGMAATPDGKGYWLVASDGGIFTFGDAAFYGSHGGSPLNKPVVGMAATPSGNGYWLVASDGGIFTYGDAAFYGSHGGSPLNKPIVGMAASPDGGGYWLVASDGGIFTYGDAPFYGSAAVSALPAPVVAITS